MTDGSSLLPAFLYTCRIQGGKDAKDASNCRSFSIDEPSIIGLFCGKEPSITGLFCGKESSIKGLFCGK